MGFPPFVGVAVNFTSCPWQIYVRSAVILTDGNTEVLTSIDMLFEVAIGKATQLNDEVITTLTVSAFAREVV